MSSPIKVALARIPDYAQPRLGQAIAEILEGAIVLPAACRVLVKPNLLMAHALACATPGVVACLCRWLLDHGARITVADSPAFGSARHVARAIGLQAALKPLGLAVSGFSRPRRVLLQPLGSAPVPAMLAPEALDCDLIFSVPRVKAHSQLRATLAVKNCFGCMCGLRKALAHAPRQLTLELFAARVAALWAALPPVAALADGVVSMSRTGPRDGSPCPTRLLGASQSAPALDRAILAALRLDAAQIPLARALMARAAQGEAAAWPVPVYPLARPEDFLPAGFEVPQQLKSISFNPLVLGKSLLRRILAQAGGRLSN